MSVVVYAKKEIKKLALCTAAIVIVASYLLLAVTPRVSANGSAIVISGCADLEKIGYDEAYPFDGDYVLGGVIDCTGSEEWNEGDGFRPIGSSYEDAFTGTFDGQGYSISNLSINRPQSAQVGLFGYTYGATIESVHIVNAKVTGEVRVGALAGVLNAGTTVRYSSVVNTAPGSGVFAVGDQDNNAHAGGLAGSLANATVHDSFVRSNITAELPGNVVYAGTAIGSTMSGGSIDRLYAVGTIHGPTGEESVGPIFGSLYNDTTVGSVFWNNEVYGSEGTGIGTESYSNGANGTGRSTAWLKTASNFIAAEWDFDTVWGIDGGKNDGYPYLNNVNTGEESPPLTADTDKNGDGILDSEQTYVSGFTSQVSGKPVALEVIPACSLTEATIRAEGAASVADAGYSYPEGLFDFTVHCSGSQTTVKQYYHDVAPANLVARKYNPVTNTYFAIEDAVVATQQIHERTATVVTYQIVDGGKLDIDGEVNGVIKDPAGLALRTAELAETGIATHWLYLAALAISTVSGATLVYVYRRVYVAATRQ